MYDVANLLVRIKKAPEEVKLQLPIFSNPPSVKKRDMLQKSIGTINDAMSSAGSVLDAIADLSNSNRNLRLLHVTTKTAYAELRRSQLLLKMVLLNLEPIPIPAGITGMLEGPIRKTMEPAEERAMSSALLTIAADLTALVIHLDLVAEQFQIEVNEGTIPAQ
jgi:hypothetical protein